MVSDDWLAAMSEPDPTTKLDVIAVTVKSNEKTLQRIEGRVNDLGERVVADHAIHDKFFSKDWPAALNDLDRNTEDIARLRTRIGWLFGLVAACSILLGILVQVDNSEVVENRAIIDQHLEHHPDTLLREAIQDLHEQIQRLQAR